MTVNGSNMAGRDEPVRVVPGGLNRFLYTGTDWATLDGVYDSVNYVEIATNVMNAELVSSELANGLHAPVLDIDVPHELVASSTPGHSHLYLDVPMTWSQYRRFLTTLAGFGVIESEYANVSIRRGRSEVRAPWVKKPGLD